MDTQFIHVFVHLFYFRSKLLKSRPNVTNPDSKTMKQAKEGTYTCIHTCEWCTCTSHLPYVHVCIFKYMYMVMTSLVNSVVLCDKAFQIIFTTCSYVWHTYPLNPHFNKCVCVHVWLPLFKKSNHIFH